MSYLEAAKIEEASPGSELAICNSEHDGNLTLRNQGKVTITFRSPSVFPLGPGGC